MRLSTAGALVVFCLGLAGMSVIYSRDRDGVLFLLVFPIWIVARDLGWKLGLASMICALAVVAAFEVAGGHVVSMPGYVALVILFGGALVAGARAALSAGVSASAPGQSLIRLLTAKPQIPHSRESLSHRELEILETIATGAKNSQIADRFVISENTVKSHVKQILKKLAVANRTEAAYRYVELYGRPLQEADGSPAITGAEHEAETLTEAASSQKAMVFAIAEGERAQLRLQDGRTVEAPLLAPLHRLVKVGSAALVYFDHRGHAVGWYLPHAGLGVDMRNWAP